MATHEIVPGTFRVPVEPDTPSTAEELTPSKPQNKPRKKLIRRTDRDYSQALRRGYQFAFLLLNVWLGGQFYLWVRHFETAGQSPYVPRPPEWKAGYPSRA
jgi:hypothetical protein